MKIPHKETVVDLAEAERADYSANPENATLVPALRVPADCAGLRLDQVLVRLWPQHSRSRLQNWIREGRVSIDENVVTETKYKLWGRESVSLLEAPDERNQSALPEDIALDIVHEDEALIIVNKPAGLVVHPGSGNWSGTLMNALLHHLPAQAAIPRAGIVHRLDKDTSGLMVVAKTLAAQTELVRQLQARTVKRYYQALVRGVLERGDTIDAPIGRHPTQRVKMAVVKNGKPARTHFRIAERFIDCTLLDCALETGRTHQIRVHLTSIGHPLVGDSVYGGGASRIPIGPDFPRQALHARRLGLVHPESGKPMLWKAPLPDDMDELIALARTEAFEARALAEDEDDDWDETLEGGPEIIYAYGDSGSDDEDDEQ